MLKFPESKVGQFSVAFIAEAFSFFIIVANTRAFTQGSYAWTAITDTLFSAQSFVMAKLMIDDQRARSWSVGLGLTVGGTVGSLLAIYATKKLYGQ